MKWINLKMTIPFLALLAASCAFNSAATPLADHTPNRSENTSLPPPNLDGNISVERAMFERRSVREYQEEPLSLSQVSQILWSAQGITSPNGYRTAPSAGALYPLELYLVVGNVEGIEPGIYKYDPRDHSITEITIGDHRKQLMASALNQNAIQDAPLVLVLGAVYERTSVKYGDRGSRYVHMEIGFVAENIYLQAQALDLGTVFIGAFLDDEVKRIICLEDMEQPLGIMPIGVK